MHPYSLKSGTVTAMAALVVGLALVPALGGHEPMDIHIEETSHVYPLGVMPLNPAGVSFVDLPKPTGALPTRFDWRDNDGDWTTPIRNQGQCGSCWAFGAIGALEAAVNLECSDPSVDMDLSEQYLVSCGPGSGCGGGNAYYAFEWLADTGGVLPESCFPYAAEDVPCDGKCDGWEDYLLPIGDYWMADHPTDEEIKNVLIERGPLVADMAVFDDLFRYRGGVYEHPGEESERDINHQPVIVGYNDDEGCWIVKNSWGNLWGEDTYDVTGERGWFRIAYGDCCMGCYVHGVESDVCYGNDTGRPEVTLVSPEDGHWYVYGSRLLPVLLGRSRVIGPLAVTADAQDVEITGEEASGVDRVEFYLDGVQMYSDKAAPYEWEMKRADRPIGLHTIHVRAYDNAGNPSVEASSIDILVLF